MPSPIPLLLLGLVSSVALLSHSQALRRPLQRTSLSLSAKEVLAFNGLLFALPASLAFKASKSSDMALRVMGDGIITPLSISALRVLALVYLQLGFLTTVLAFTLPLQAASILRALTYVRVLTLIGDAHSIGKSNKVSKVPAAVNAIILAINAYVLRA